MTVQLDFALAELVAKTAGTLGIETALIGAYVVGIYGHIRATSDIDFATAVDLSKLAELRAALESQGLHAKLNEPDDEDPLGGVVRVWITENEDGDPIDPIDVVNFKHPLHRIKIPVQQFIQDSLPVEGKPGLRYVTLPHLILTKLYAGDLQGQADVVALLLKNPDVNVEDIRALSKSYHFDKIDDVIAEVQKKKKK